MAAGDKESDPQGMFVSPSHAEGELRRSPGGSNMLIPSRMVRRRLCTVRLLHMDVRAYMPCHIRHARRIYESVCTAEVSHLPAPFQHSAPLLICSPPCPRPSLSRLSIHLGEGFTLLTVKFTHIHNYVFNQSHLKASWMRAFFGSSRRSKSSLGGRSGLIPIEALDAND